MHEAERGLFDLCRGRALLVTHDGDAAALVAAVEGLGDRALDRLRALDPSSLRLAVTHHRAAAMGLTNGGRPHPVSLGLEASSSAEDILRLCSSIATGESGPAADRRQASAAEAGGLALARLARLLPAIVGVRVDERARALLTPDLDDGTTLTVTTSQISDLAGRDATRVTRVSEGPVPLEATERAQFVCYREANGLLEHVAIVIGDRAQWPDPVPVRIHSACLTGDLFGSLRCDCGEQLHGSLRFFAERGGGVLLYMAQEGRGIGLGNKLKAYTLQQEGLDTVDADQTLGFGADERQYDAALAMLRDLSIERILLLTNNPDKVRAMREGGILVIDRRPLYGTLNRHNLRYVKAKVSRAGHWLGDMLSGAVPGK